MPQLFENEFIRQGISFENASQPDLRYVPEVTMDVPQILRQILEVSGLKQAALGEKVGVSQGTISKWISDTQSPTMREWQKVERFARRYPKLRALLRPAAERRTVPIMGRIGAGAEIEPEFEQVPPEGLDQVDLPFDVPPDIIGFQVVGVSMLPAYRDGDVVLVWKDQRYDTEDYIGEDAAVRTGAGRRYLKEIEAGAKRGLFHLRSHNADPIRNVSIEWVGEIYLIVKASQVRRASKIAQERSSARA